MITITGQLKSDIDRLWEEFWTGGITNPLTVIEQISFLMFVRMLDSNETRNEKIQQRTGKPFRPIFGPGEQRLRWSNFKQLNAEEMLRVVRDEVFPFLKKAVGGGEILGNGNQSANVNLMADAMLLIQKPSLLVSAVNKIDNLPLSEGDTKGNLYEYLLSKLTTAGINGQFRTPRHIIELMVRMIDPRPGETVCDPACGTAGFLVESAKYLVEQYTSPEGVFEDDEGIKHYSGDLLGPQGALALNEMFYGFDFDVTMLRIATMNLMLHGVEQPRIRYQDTLSNSFPERAPSLAANHFDVILANPPFTGSLDEKDVAPSLTGKVKTRKTELLFLTLILRMLKQGGRSATIVPDGVLFGSSKAHLALRRTLVEENQLEAIISLPSGVFKPYAGVSTAIVVFTKGGRTEEVFFYDVQADGYSLDDKRVELDRSKHENDNLKDVLARWKNRDEERARKRTDQSFLVPKADIEANGFDLSINRYKEIVYEQVEIDPPQKILSDLKAIEAEIQREMAELEVMLG